LLNLANHRPEGESFKKTYGFLPHNNAESADALVDILVDILVDAFVVKIEKIKIKYNKVYSLIRTFSKIEGR